MSTTLRTLRVLLRGYDDRAKAIEAVNSAGLMADEAG